MIFLVIFSFFSMSPPPPRSTLFPYTTLFRSWRGVHRGELLRSRRCDCERLACHDRAQTAGDELRVVGRSEEHTSELQSQSNLVCRLLLEKKKKNNTNIIIIVQNISSHYTADI